MDSVHVNNISWFDAFVTLFAGSAGAEGGDGIPLLSRTLSRLGSSNTVGAIFVGRLSPEKGL